MADENDDVKRILAKIGKKVRFNYPTKTEGVWEGILKDRVVITAPSWTGTMYYDVVDLIEFIRGEKRFEVIRFGYYRKRDKLVWAGQFTLTEPPETWKEIFKKAKMKEWFRKILE
ncbi:MAG: hypothetical protein QXK89_05000 [Candidatus Bathyarchaeia archaeon]